jgi:hypothetical protein
MPFLRAFSLAVLYYTAAGSRLLFFTEFPLNQVFMAGSVAHLEVRFQRGGVARGFSDRIRF